MCRATFPAVAPLPATAVFVLSLNLTVVLKRPTPPDKYGTSDTLDVNYDKIGALLSIGK